MTVFYTGALNGHNTESVLEYKDLGIFHTETLDSKLTQKEKKDICTETELLILRSIGSGLLRPSSCLSWITVVSSIDTPLTPLLNPEI